MHEVPFTVGRS